MLKRVKGKDKRMETNTSNIKMSIVKETQIYNERIETVG